MKEDLINRIKKWIGRYLVLFIVEIISLILVNRNGNLERMMNATIAILVISVLLGILTGAFEYYLSSHVNKYNDRIINLFNGEKLSESTSKFRIGKYDIYCNVNFELERSKFNMITFHIPRNQIDKKKKKPKTHLSESTFEDKETYLVYSTYGFSLKKTKRELLKIFSNEK